jgi:aspartate ammonia-lyase
VAEKRVQKMTVNPQNLRHACAESRAVFVSVLAPTLGPEQAERIVQRAVQEEKSIRQVIAEERLLSTEQLDAILDQTALAAT